MDIAWWLNFKLSKGSRITWQLWPGTKQHKPRRALLLVTERQGVFFRRTGGPTYPISTTALWTAFFWLMDCPAWYSQKPPDPTDLKRMNQFYTWCRSPAFCCMYSMFLNRLEGLCLLHRVGHWWRTYLLLMRLFPWKFLLGRGPGLTLECTGSFALRSCGTPPSAFLALWNRIAGLPWNLGSDNMIAGGHVRLLGLIRWLMRNLVGLWGGGVLIACFLAQWNRDRL